MENTSKTLIENILISNSIEPKDDIFEKLRIYYEFLVESNEKFNLTSITNIDDVYIKHFADSMLGANLYKHGATVCDIGTGAGFPGVVLKIIRPDLHITLVDSLNKRINFLNELIVKLNLDGVVAIHARAEDKFFKEKYLNTFDYVVARAVASLQTLTEYCLPFVKVGGCFIAYKSDSVNTEINDALYSIKILGGGAVKRNIVTLNDNINRSIVVVNKITPTSPKYPRGQNKPRLSPLLLK